MTTTLANRLSRLEALVGPDDGLDHSCPACGKALPFVSVVDDRSWLAAGESREMGDTICPNCNAAVKVGAHVKRYSIVIQD